MKQFHQLLCLLTFCILSLVHIIKVNNTLTANNSNKDNISMISDINDITYETQSKNISDCGPLYLTGVPPSVPIKRYLSKRGFNIKCKQHDRKLTNRQPDPNLKWVQRLCWKYNNKLKKNKPFCDGGELIYFDRAWMWQTIDIERKTSLNKVLSTYCNKYHNDINDNTCDFSLLSYNIGNKKERDEFLTKHIDCNNNQSQYTKTWVFKENKNAGKGIHIYNNHQLIYRIITADISENINNCTYNPIQNETFLQLEGFNNYKQTKDGKGYVVNREDCLIQTFVSNPLLLKSQSFGNVEHVFHLRSYFMVASYTNPFIVLHFPKGILWINPNEYKNKQQRLDKKAILTNWHITGNMNLSYFWGYTELQLYLDEKYGKDLFGGNYVTNKLNDDIKHVLKHTFNASLYNNKLKENKIFERNNNYHFDLLCADIIITDEFKLKLLEINSMCGEVCGKKVLARKKRDGVYDWDCWNRYNEAVEITMEVFEKKYNNQSIQKLDSLAHYEIVLWE